MDVEKRLVRWVDSYSAEGVNTLAFDIQIRAPAGDHLPSVENHSIENPPGTADARMVIFPNQSEKLRISFHVSRSYAVWLWFMVNAKTKPFIPLIKS